MEEGRPGELFELAVSLDKGARKALLDLVKQESPATGERLAGQLQDFERFQSLLNEKDAFAKLLNRLPPVPSVSEPAAGGETTPIRQGEDLSHPPSQLGPYRIEGKIGSGGQGTVYLAHQETTERRVALKLIHRGSAIHPEDRARFKRELKTLAIMNHAHIAAIYEADTTPEGASYFSMEYVDGPDILSYCRNRRLSLRQILALFLQVCQGVSHAHQRLILHRDLKPSNVLVAEVDGQPRVKIVDFGIARSLEEGQGKGGGLTQMGLVGTPGYMAPEMFCGTDPDTRLDIYALGVLLYQMVTGKAPLNPPDHLSLDEKWRFYREREPARPSTRLPGKISPDLDAVILKAMAKDPNRRYASVIELERDCGFYLEGRPVSARRPSLFYQLRMLIARNKVLTGATLLIFLLLVGGLAATTWAERKAQKERRRFEASFGTLQNLLASPDPYRMGAQARVIDVLRTGEAAFDERLDGDLELEAMIRDVWGRTYYGLGFYENARAHLEKTVAIMSLQHGDAEPRTLDARRWLSLAHIRAGDYVRAEQALRDIYQGYPQRGFDTEKLAVLAALADVYQAQSEPERAEPLLRQMEGHLHSVANTASRGQGLFTLANIHHGLGSSQAEALYRQAQSLLSAGDPANPKALAAMAGLANHLRRRDRLSESEALYRRVIDLRVQTLGASHDLTQHARAALALCLAEQSRFVEAEALITGVTQTLSRRDASHPETLAMIRRMATVLRLGGNYTQATQLLSDLVIYYRDNDLAHSPGALLARSNLADVLILGGRIDEAVNLLTETIEDMKAVKGPDHLMTVTAMITLGQAHEAKGERDNAEAVYQKAVNLLGAKNPESREFHYYRSIRAHNLTGLRRFEEAETVLLESLAASSPGSAIHKEIRAYLEAHYRARGHPERAATYGQMNQK